MAVQLRPGQRLLVRGVNWLGDAVMTTPALLRLREALPGVHIALLTPAKLADLWQGHPALDSVLSSPAGSSVLHNATRVRSGRFDAALALPNSPRSALELWLGRVPIRVGYNRPWRSMFLTHSIAWPNEFVAMKQRTDAEIRALAAQPAFSPGRPIPRSQPHGVERHHLHHYLRLGQVFGASPEPLPPRVAVADHAITAVLQRLAIDATQSSQMRVAIHPGAEYGPAKQWPADRFAQLIVEVSKSISCQWLLVGSKAEAALTARIAADARSGFKKIAPERSARSVVIDAAGRTTLGELAAVLKASHAALGNDSGPLHLAAAVGTPVVALFGSTSPELTAPGLPGEPRHPILRRPPPCAPCFRRHCPIDLRCLTGIRVADVASALTLVLAR